MGAAGAVVYVLSLATAPWVVDRPVTQWVSKTVGRKAGRKDRFQLSGAEWTAEDDAVAIVDWQRQAAASHRAGNEANGRGYRRKDHATACKSQAGSLGSPTSEILEALKVSGTSVIFDLRSESGSYATAVTSLL
jgi:hypothetical protein